ncbi:DUF5723 family protein [Tenacibaculum maritimum]|uniref:DUF5723 family protein n=1 Tax=Tenacibaculum maritimum TaxID=107401 RepID=UPI0012E665A6|nr:DUF5723 family protein [Tenacibaculum maritimum]MCD9580631.1 DUF5723 family protein [Tenacibaculum maritimum]MCD9634878.1 DUF5723 family protein [Tenacibaculum maritimum]CAA0152528.1 conserved hypothetical protein [Tenacibaculum maritimum]CAA0220268.1 conserved hypothetical protein [Tenacibaculum maritimum]
MKHILIRVFVFMIAIHNLSSQNKQVLYGFDQIPQALLLNPGVEVNYKYHVGIPLLSGFSTNLGSTGFTVADLFRDDNVSFTNKVNRVLSKLAVNDHIAINSQVEVLNGGIKLDKKTYLNFGFYTEVAVFSQVPKDILQLLNEGNGAHLNRAFSIGQVMLKANVQGVLHVGAARKLNEQLTVGGRLKIYSGAINVQTQGNTGTFRTVLGRNSSYTHHLNNINASIHSSGIVNEDAKIALEMGDVLNKTFLGGNLGLGVDLGVTYHVSPQVELTASLLDLGFINYSKNIKNGEVKGDYTFSGIEFQYDPNNPTDYWKALEDDFKEKVPSEENTNSYVVAQPVKFNGAIKYKWGKNRREENCSDMAYENYFNNAIGGQLHATFRPLGPQLALTGFYERAFGDSFKTKVTYTFDEYSFSNLGFGISMNLGAANVYGMVDNIIEFTDIADSNYTSFQFGINLIMN